MELPSLQNTDCTGKQVLMRVDFNVAVTSLSEPTESFRLTTVKDSVDHILSFPDSTVTLITHFGGRGGKKDEKYSVKQLIVPLEQILDKRVSFTPDCLLADDFSDTRVALRENLRFYAEEEANDASFAEKLSLGFDLYVNEAFSVSHREHASVVDITQFLPSVAGMHLQKEITELQRAISDPARPAIAILAGAKIETKLPLIKVFEKAYDQVLLGGLIANEAIDQDIQFQPNVSLPVDFRDENRFDIGDQTITEYIKVIQTAKTIVWNGTLGMFEKEPFDTGTNRIVEALTQSSAYVIAGGGDSLTAIQKAGVFDKFDLVSTGGGAMLAYLAGESLPGLEVLR
jgi:phosphoglycerate kinase